MTGDGMTPPSGTSDRFARMAARDLERRPRSLPEAFTGRWNLVLVAFRREHQSDVDTWTSWQSTVGEEHREFECYEVPVLAVRWLPMRRAIDGGMAYAVGDAAIKQRTMTVYTNVARAAHALDIDDTSVITALLVDGTGTIRWRTTGPATPEATASVMAVLADGGGTSADGDRPA